MTRIKAFPHDLHEEEPKMVRNPDILENYLKDESNIGGGSAEAVVYPESEAHISKLLYKAHVNRIRIAVSGGGTGLTGARIPLGGYIMSMEYMTRPVTTCREGERIVKGDYLGKGYVIRIGRDSEGRPYTVVPPGIPLNVLIDMISRYKLIYPPNPTEKNAFVGGNVATNSSGAWTFRFAPIRHYVRRLRIVLPNGDIVEINRGEYNLSRRYFELETSSGEIIDVPLPKYRMPSLKKHSAGYYAKDEMDLIDLFIGAEGTLGVYSEIEIGLEPMPDVIFPIYAHFSNMDDLLGFVDSLKKFSVESSASIFSIEFFDGYSVDFIRRKYRPPLIPEESKGIIFFEIAGEEEDVFDTMAEVSEILDEFNVLKVMASEDPNWIEKSREMRHAVPEGVSIFVRRHNTHKVSTDIAVPENRFGEMMDTYLDIGESSGIHYVMYGHIGDDHIHFNFLPRNVDELRKSLDHAVELMKKGVALGGTISAEHGVGKKVYFEDGEPEPILKIQYGEKGLIESAMLKKTMDESLILNIGNIVSEKYLVT
jgi:D-lactate dehydrogenase (cytochrome)